MKLSVYILVLVCSACWVQAQETPTTSPTDTTEEGGQCMGRGLGNTLPTIGEEYSCSSIIAPLIGIVQKTLC